MQDVINDGLETLTVKALKEFPREDGNGVVRQITYQGVGRPMKGSNGRFTYKVPRVTMLVEDFLVDMPIEEAEKEVLGSSVRGKIIWVESTNEKADIFRGNNPVGLMNLQTNTPITFKGKQIFGTNLFTQDPNDKDLRLEPRDPAGIATLEEEPVAKEEPETQPEEAKVEEA